MSIDKISSDSQNSKLIMRVRNSDLDLEREIWKVDDLKLDPTNQRVSFEIQNSLGLINSDAKLHEVLWKIDAVKKLSKSIYQNGGLIEDPIIRRDGTVIEGNCRTVSLREINKNYPTDERFKEIYVKVLPDDITDQDIMILLGALHIAGKIEWRAFEQAEYVYKMNRDLDMHYDYLSNLLHWSKSKISHKITAYEETKNYLNEYDDDRGINIFSHFEELMKKKQLRDQRKKNPNFMPRFNKWLYEKRFDDAKDIRLLPKILEEKHVMDVFERDGFKAAQAMIYAGDPSLISNLYSSLDAAISQLDSLSMKEIKAIQSGDEAKITKFRNLKEALESVEKVTGLKF